MKKIEDLLKKQELARGTPDFDARMDGLFRKPPLERPAMLRRRVMIWQALAVSLLTGGFGYWLGHAPSSQPQEHAALRSFTTMYVMEARTDSVRNTFDVSADIEPFYQPPAPPIPATVWVEKMVDVTEKLSI